MLVPLLLLLLSLLSLLLRGEAAEGWFSIERVLGAFAQDVWRGPERVFAAWS